MNGAILRVLIMTLGYICIYSVADTSNIVDVFFIIMGGSTIAISQHIK